MDGSMSMTTSPKGRSVTYVVAGSNAPAHVKAQADYVCDGTADNVEIQAAITALSAGRTWKERIVGIGKFTLAAAITIPSYTIFDFSQAELATAAGGTPTHYAVNATDCSYSDITVGKIDPAWVDNAASVGVLFDGCKYCTLDINCFRIWKFLLINSTNQSCTGNTIKVIGSGKNGITLSGNAAHPIEENVFPLIYIVLNASAGTAIDFAQYADRNKFNYVYIYMNIAASTGVVYNSATPANDMAVFANNIDYLYMDQAIAGTVSIDGNRTSIEPSYIKLVTTASNPTEPDLQSNCYVVFLPGSKLGASYYYTTRGYVAPGEIRTASGSLTAGVANAIAFAWHNPEAQDIVVKKVVVEITTGSVTANSVIDVGIADDAAGTNRGVEFFDDLDANDVDINDSWLAGDGGTQTKWIFCQDSASATDGWVVGQILVADAAALVGKYYIEYVGR